MPLHAVDRDEVVAFASSILFLTAVLAIVPMSCNSQSSVIVICTNLPDDNSQADNQC
jgi:hypothetical protein